MKRWVRDKRVIVVLAAAVLIIVGCVVWLVSSKEEDATTLKDLQQEIEETAENAAADSEAEESQNTEEDQALETAEENAEENETKENGDSEVSESEKPQESSAEIEKSEPADGRTENDLPDYSQLDPNDFPVAPSETTESSVLEAAAASFVGELGDSGIVAHGIQAFEGIFIETMEDKECGNVATILLENTTNQMVSYMALQLKAGDATWTFEASAIPAGAYVMVQEKNASAYGDVTVKYEEMHIAAEESVSKMEDKVTVTPTDQGGLEITNISSAEIPVLRLFYKLKNESTYIGGITYSVTLEKLAAGSSQTIYPSHYVKDYAEVLMIKEYDE